ncbi:hypothetical protein TeGR_g2851, partial [Tetraparma gracilis]
MAATVPIDGIEMQDISTSAAEGDKKVEEEKVVPASFGDLFQFADTQTIIIFGVGNIMALFAGATLPAINIVFGEIIDAIAAPDNVSTLVNNAVIGMCVLAGFGFVSFFLAYSMIAYAGAKIANGFRLRYLDAVLRQDATFFDHAAPGSVSVMLEDAAIDIQEGLSDKFCAAVQGVCQLVAGFAVAFYFGPELSAILCACVPLLIAVTYLLTTYGSEDGIFGKEAYSAASNIASETILNIKTIFSLNAETNASKKYDDKLKIAEKAAIKQGTGAGFIGGMLFFVMFCMYGLGFWFGGKMIADSTEEAMEKYPIPVDFYTSSTYENNQNVTAFACAEYEGDQNSYDTCACGIMWDLLDESVGAVPPNCGCSYKAGTFSVESVCFTGGKTILVFFSILVGGFGLGTAGPGAKEMGKARIAAAKMLETINRKPLVDINQPGKKLTGKVAGELVLDNVMFEYKKKGTGGAAAGEDVQPVFGGVNLKIPAGKTVALVGESGCGKSTIAKLVQRFYDPSGGSILLDGTDLKKLDLKDLRSNIGVVSQEPLLFNTSVLENIRNGKPGASDAECIEAAKKANAHEFIDNFPDKYHTGVGPKGSKLGGGQKQRVAIARAILRNPAVLILDEATSALDNQSEKIVQKALDDVVTEGGRTTIVIAHRLSTVRNADIIVVLGSKEGMSTAKGSVIVEQGTHDELINIEGGLYAALASAGEGNKEGSGELEKEVQRSLSLESERLSDMEKESQRSAGAEEGTEGEDDEETGMCGGMCGGGKKKKDEKKTEEEKYKMPKNRIWEYSKNERGWIAFGTAFSAIKGCCLPLVSLVFAEMINCWYKFDMDDVRGDSLKWSYMFYALAALQLISETIQKGAFELVGERLTRRLRSDMFRSILRQDVTWFEDEANSQGVLMSRLTTDVKYVRLVTGQSVGATAETFAALTTGLVIAFSASWEICLVMTAMVPLLGVCEVFQWMAIKGSGGTIKKEMEKSQAKLTETVNGIREVQAFALEQTIAGELSQIISETVSKASTKQAIVKGVMMGLIQLVQFLVYALAFWVGGQLIDPPGDKEPVIKFEDFNKALWAMAFAASGLGQAAMFAGDAAKASNAVKSIFTMLDRRPPIDSEPWENDGLASGVTGDAVERAVATAPPKAIAEDAFNGEFDLKDVNFAYPTRKAAKVFDQLTLKIPAGKSVALVGSSGSGKSTVVQLLERFYDPIVYADDGDKQSGEPGWLELDGVKTNSLDARWLRQNMGLVGQEPVLFNDTIFNNIALGLKGKSAGEDVAARVEEAAKLANAHDFISKLADGYETNVGNAGGK